MNQRVFHHRIDTLRRLGHQRIKNRFFRRIRYRYLNPCMGFSIFPMPQSSEYGLNRLPGLEGFYERLGKMISFLKQILEQADELSQNSFSVLNLPSVKFAHRVNRQFNPETQ
jgi:hypothetical protein